VSVASEVEGFIVNEIASGQGLDSLAYDTDLLEAEVIDSLGIVELIAFLEKTYSIKVDDEDLDPENFRTVERIVGFVGRKEG
jgi:acyl carrier protein